MANKFCLNCGSPLSEDLAFCTGCGAPVKNEDVPQSSDAAHGNDSPGSDVAQGATQGAVQAVPTQATPNPFTHTAAQPVVPATAQPVSAQPNAAKNKMILIIGVVAIAVIAVVIILFALGHSPSRGGSGVVDTGAMNASEASSDASSASSATSANEALTPEQENAIPIYERMGALDARISACATEFNQNCLNPDRALRERCAQAAEEALEEAMGIQTTISALSSGGAHELGDYTGHLRELGQDLYNRINVIDEAWSRSLEFSDPAAHESYIIAPIVADSDGSDNKYYRHFKDNYPNWNPANS